MHYKSLIDSCKKIHELINPLEIYSKESIIYDTIQLLLNAIDILNEEYGDKIHDEIYETKYDEIFDEKINIFNIVYTVCKKIYKLIKKELSPGKQIHKLQHIVKYLKNIYNIFIESSKDIINTYISEQLLDDVSNSTNITNIKILMNKLNILSDEIEYKDIAEILNTSIVILFHRFYQELILGRPSDIDKRIDDELYFLLYITRPYVMNKPIVYKYDDWKITFNTHQLYQIINFRYINDIPLSKFKKFLNICQKNYKKYTIDSSKTDTSNTKIDHAFITQFYNINKCLPKHLLFGNFTFIFDEWNESKDELTITLKAPKSNIWERQMFLLMNYNS